MIPVSCARYDGTATEAVLAENAVLLAQDEREILGEVHFFLETYESRIQARRFRTSILDFSSAGADLERVM